ncbi:GAF domain-containing protein [Pseudomonas taeanensis]|uniref:GAF domain-containing protein n=1 Tax=Pseudomonas taeanensis TaxID=574962 RepID=UPI00128FC677
MVYRAVSGVASGQLELRLKLASSLSGLCVLSGEITRCIDTETDNRVDRVACRRMHIRSMVAIPLVHSGITVGVLKALHKPHLQMIRRPANAVLQFLSGASRHDAPRRQSRKSLSLPQAGGFPKIHRRLGCPGGAGYQGGGVRSGAVRVPQQVA